MNRIPIGAAILAILISSSLGIAFIEIGAAQTENASENASVNIGNITINAIGNLTISATGNATVNLMFNNLTSIQCD
ncbi:Uncharacterised protein [uncultured archaeon]|nr:Uncharacterised protein [uncultured archaeon]